jgi:transcriptional regulator with XRE-family HTH domain
VPDIASYICPTPKAVSARIKSERARLGLTQRQAAEILGVAQQTYQQWEAARTLPTLPTLFGLVEALGMDPRALLPEWFAAVDRPRAMERA